MKAAVYDRYGPADVVRVSDVDRPAPGDNEVLIGVRAAAVNPLDCLFQGKPYTLRLMTGLRRPRTTRLGVDVAGVVEAAGRDVTRFRPGDQVFGFCVREPGAPRRCGLGLSGEPGRVRVCPRVGGGRHAGQRHVRAGGCCPGSGSYRPSGPS